MLIEVEPPEEIDATSGFDCSHVLSWVTAAAALAGFPARYWFSFVAAESCVLMMDWYSPVVRFEYTVNAEVVAPWAPACELALT